MESNIKVINEALEIIQQILPLAQTKQFNLLDNLLATVQVEKCSCVQMVSWLRSTYSYRDQLQQWIPLRDKIADQMRPMKFKDKGREYTYETVLKGLL